MSPKIIIDTTIGLYKLENKLPLTCLYNVDKYIFKI